MGVQVRKRPATNSTRLGYDWKRVKNKKQYDAESVLSAAVTIHTESIHLEVLYDAIMQSELH